MRHPRKGDVSELDLALVRELAGEFGFWPATTNPRDIERHRRQCDETDAHHREWLREYGPDGSKRNRWRNLSRKSGDHEAHWAIMVFRTDQPTIGSLARIAPPPGVTLPVGGSAQYAADTR